MSNLGTNRKLKVIKVISWSTSWAAWDQARVSTLSHNLWSICVNKLEEIVNKNTKEEGLDGPKLMLRDCFHTNICWWNCVILIWFDMQQLHDALETFCQINELIVHVDQTKIKAMKAIQPIPHHYKQG